MDEMPQPIGFDEDGNPIFAEDMMGSEGDEEMDHSPEMHEMDSYGHEGSPEDVICLTYCFSTLMTWARTLMKIPSLPTCHPWTG